MRLAATAVAALALAACNSVMPTSGGPNTLTTAEAAAGWKLLFNGKDFTGWRMYRGGAVSSPWLVDNGTISVTGPGVDIISTDEFSDFEMTYEWKISPKGNSGVMYFVTETAAAPQTYNTGPEMQVLDNDGHADGKIPSHRAGALYDLVVPPDGLTRPVGEWNQARIKVSKGKIEHWLNGKLAAESPYGNAIWRSMVANSKFKTMPLFGTASTGHIALQDHGDRVWYRSLKIRSL